MQRRAFTAGLLTLPSAPLIPSAAFGTQPEQRETPPQFGTLTLSTALGQIVPSYLIFAVNTVSRLIGVPLNRTFPQTNENRSGLLTPTLDRQFRVSDQVGVLRVAGQSTLVADMQTMHPLDQVYLINQQTSWRINAGQLARTVQTNLPVLGTLPLLGRLFRRGGSRADHNDLLIIVTPSIIDKAL